MNKKPNLNAFLSLLVLSMLLLTLLTTPALADASWDIQTVDENGDGHGVSMALDSKDHPHLCYTAHVDGYYRNPRYLTYASWNGSAWNIQNVTENVGFIGYSSLALDSNNNPHITYEARAHGRLLYASWTGEEWSIQTVDPEGGEGFLVLDSVDTPHIVYGGANGTLRYAVLKGSNWSIQTVDSSSIINLGYLASMALDSSDNPRIGYYGGYHGQYFIASVLYAKLESPLLSASELIVIIVVVVVILTGLLIYFKKRKH